MEHTVENLSLGKYEANLRFGGEKSLIKNEDDLCLFKKVYEVVSDIKNKKNTVNVLLYAEDSEKVKSIAAYIRENECNVITRNLEEHEERENLNVDIVLFCDLENNFDFSLSQIDYLTNRAFKLIMLIQREYVKYKSKMIFSFRNRVFYEAVSGLLKTIQLENTEFVYKSILFRDMYIKDSARALLDEALEDIFIYKDICYDNNVRMVSEMRVFAENAANKHKFVVNDGVFLITGGNGGLGNILASYLVKNGARKVILIGRSPYSEEIEKRIKLISESVVQYRVCDVTEASVCEQLVSDMLIRYGSIEGIFHCAGVLNDALSNSLDYSKFSECIEIKVQGIINIMDALTKYSCITSFVKIFSSITSVFGNAGQSAYSFANGLANMLALDENKYSMFSIQSICWPLWENGGMRVFKEKMDNIFEATGQQILKDEIGLRALEIVSESGEVCPIITFGNRAAIWRYMESTCRYLTQYEDKSENKNNDNISMDDIEKILIDVVQDIVQIDTNRIDVNAHWELYGIDSISIMQMNEKLKKIIPEVSVAIFYECTSIAALTELVYRKYRQSLSNYMNKTSSVLTFKKDNQREENHMNKINWFETRRGRASSNRKNKTRFNTNKLRNTDIAIIGMAGRYPMADNLEEFWENLLMGKDCIEEIPKDRWDYKEYYNEKKGKKGYTNSKWGGFIKDYNCFDAQFFHMTPREARYIDPQERIFLECSWHALEDAGYTADLIQKQRVGVYVGVMYSHYQLYGLDYTESSGRRAFNSSYASIANRVSFYFNLHGPSMAIDTMCSSSLTAIHLARESILNHECEIAIAGGVNLSVHPNKYINLSQSNFLSSDGRCRSFGDGGDGYVPSEGVGAVILKGFEQAKNDGDYIYGILKATAINHGGHANGFTVPNSYSQTEVIKRAMEMASITPEQYAYMEAHGTGTPLGDPIELNAMQNALGKMNNSCPIGSVKSNIGHCEAASGIAGLTKILLQMKNGKLVPSIHSSILNSNIDFQKYDFYVQDKLCEWKHKVVNSKRMPYIAGLSSFGAGGSNAHIVIEEYMENKEIVLRNSRYDANVMVISAQNENSLFEYCQIYRKYLDEMKDKEISFEHIAYATQHMRSVLTSRLAVVAQDYNDAINKLDQYIANANVISADIYWNNENEQQGGYESKLDQRIGEDSDIELMRKCAKKFVCTGTVDWEQLWDKEVYPRVDLPQYPFERTVYWLDIDDGNRKESSSNEGRKTRITNSSTIYQAKCEAEFSIKEYFVKDHVIEGKNVLPGAASLLNAKESINILTNSKQGKITDWIFATKAVFTTENMLLITSVNSDGEINVHTEVNSNRRLICTGEYQESDGELKKVDKSILKVKYPYTYDGQVLYENFKQNHLSYGKTLQKIEKIIFSSTEAVVKLKNMDNNYGKDIFDAVPFIDAAFQGVYAFKEELGLQDGDTMLPHKIAKFLWNENQGIPSYVYIKRYEYNNSFDIVLVDNQWNTLYSMYGFEVAKVNNHSKLDIDDILSGLEDKKYSIKSAARLLERWLEDE